MRTCTSENCAPETATFASTRCAASLERRVSRFSEDGLLGVHDEKVEGRATATAVAHAQARYVTAPPLLLLLLLLLLLVLLLRPRADDACPATTATTTTILLYPSTIPTTN
jgi:hypothetical protein